MLVVPLLLAVLVILLFLGLFLVVLRRGIRLFLLRVAAVVIVIVIVLTLLALLLLAALILVGLRRLPSLVLGLVLVVLRRRVAVFMTATASSAALIALTALPFRRIAALVLAELFLFFQFVHTISLT